MPFAARKGGNSMNLVFPGVGNLITTHKGSGIWSLASISKEKITDSWQIGWKPKGLHKLCSVLLLMVYWFDIKFRNFVIVSLLLIYPILNKIGANRHRGIKYTYFKLKYCLRVSLRVEHWSSVILTCNWSTSTKRYFYIRFLLIILNSTLKFVNFVISSLWWVPVTCPLRASWHVRVLSNKPCLHAQL